MDTLIEDNGVWTTIFNESRKCLGNPVLINTVIVIHLTRDAIINDVNQYIRYYNGTRLHATLDYQTPNEYENSQINVCN